MATSRKRPSSGFSQSTSEELPEVVIHEDTVETEATVEMALEEVVAAPVPFIEETIIPTEDPGPRFVVMEAPQPPLEAPPAAIKVPKRHPRNIPKFSRVVK